MKSFLVALSLLAATPALADQANLPGYDRFAVSAAHRPSLMQASVWYPAGTRTYVGRIGSGPVFKPLRAFIGAGVKKGKFPLLLLSHGSGGNMDAIGWLSSALAQNGIMVAAVNHPGSTSGDSSPRRSFGLKNQALDLSATLDHLLQDPYFSRFIDQDHIAAAGFSLGGATVLNIAGVKTDSAAYADYCSKHGDVAQDCLWFQKGDVDVANLPDSFEETAPDSRISAIVPVEPGFTYAIDETSLEGLEQPVHLISLGEKDRWLAADVGPEGSNLVGKLKNVSHAVFAPADHLTFLGECTPEGKVIIKEEGDDPICDDPQGTDRAEIHRQVAGSILRFLKNLP